MKTECPGAKLFKEPSPEEIVCPYCQIKIEIWTDESKAKCPHCKRIITREMSQSCIDWCPKAQECLGKEKYQAYLQEKNQK